MFRRISQRELSIFGLEVVNLLVGCPDRTPRKDTDSEPDEGNGPANEVGQAWKQLYFL